MNRYLLPLALFAVLVLFLAIGLGIDPKRVPSPLIDKPLPAFNLPKLKTPDYNIKSTDFYGEVVLLNVWASWCVSCRAEHPLFVELAKSNNGPSIYGINYKDKRTDAIEWLKYFGNPYQASAFDQHGLTGIDLGVYGVPETYIIDRSGIIRYKHIGPVTQDALNKKIMPLIKKLKASNI
ncbi:MAG: DsbE family thiol:disulfide interchange protein [Gammaproteobacteria bacterium]|nr:MAG: DsbE family thiol:disulfide interchange protein [Gammaproteobacteria bacterium]